MSAEKDSRRTGHSAPSGAFFVAFVWKMAPPTMIRRGCELRSSFSLVVSLVHGKAPACVSGNDRPVCQVLDLKELVVSEMLRDRSLMVALFQRCGKAEFNFLVNRQVRRRKVIANKKLLPCSDHTGLVFLRDTVLEAEDAQPAIVLCVVRERRSWSSLFPALKQILDQSGEIRCSFRQKV